MIEMLLGSKLVPDITNPRPEDVDVEFMLERLHQIRRFSGHPGALTVQQHQWLVAQAAEDELEPPEVVEWAEHHDDHEYATGDIPTPLQRAIGVERLHAIQARWDVAICGALGIAAPTDEVRAAIAVYDRIALASEWYWCLGRQVAELGFESPIVLRSVVMNIAYA